MSWTATSTSPDETLAFGCRLGSLLRSGDVVFLLGGLGVGKTRFAQGIAAGLGADGARSPSFALVHVYPAKIPVYHADLYRLTGRSEVEDLGLAELGMDGVLIIEWAAIAAADFPERLEVELAHLPGRDECRRLTITPHGARYIELAAELKRHADPGS